MKKVMIIALILVGALIIPAVSAETIISQHFEDYIHTGGQSTITGSGRSPIDTSVTEIRLSDIERSRTLNYIAFDIMGSNGASQRSAPFTYSLAGGPSKNGYCYVDHSRNALGTVIATRYTLFFYDWDIGSLTGSKYVTFNRTIAKIDIYQRDMAVHNNGDSYAFLQLTAGSNRYDIGPSNRYISTVSSGGYWENTLQVDIQNDGLDYNVALQREFGDKSYGSQFDIVGPKGSMYSSYDTIDIDLLFPVDSINDITITNPYCKVFSTPISSQPGQPDIDISLVTVYVQNSQTGALLTDAHIEIQDTTTDPWTEVINQTISSGQGTISLPKDSGIHFTQYRIGATVPGYQQVVPALFFRVTGPTNVVVEMEPITGGPVNENNTFVEFYVRDISANAIPNAIVQVDGQLRWTNAQGYTQFEVAKNASYPYSVTKTGYLTIEGIATVGSDDRYVVNVALMTSTPPSQTSDEVNIYIRNSQTGALLTDAHIKIQVTNTDPWAEVINQTIPSGQVTISLPKDSGIHFTQYRIGATVPGYQQVVPALFFRVTGPTNVVVEMEPITGPPVNENNTFVEFYVRDISANGIPNANVQVDGQMRWTNAQGYTQFEVAKNASYPYSVTKTGYLTIEGIATVGNDDRYVVNVALMTGTVPTQPTVSPAITVEPTPTQTSPAFQEDNIIGLSVQGLAKGFGIDYDTALLMFGLMIVFGAGGIVMSSVKGGAMEFIAGSIVGTFVAFALGLIPIWIFIIIAVVFGVYVLRVFVQGGQ